MKSLDELSNKAVPEKIRLKKLMEMDEPISK